ncbi:MAG TPA: class E sortase [Mycobacteriales bacterium]|nr:class E sortase [Mycobacteriales bacterium]
MPSISPRATVRTVGEILLTLGVIVLLFVAYELWWTGRVTRHDQSALVHTLERQWAHGENPAAVAAHPQLGTAIAILRIPRLGRNYRFAIVQGTSTADLIKGPGHYPGTALPGQVGNFAVAGHRTTYLHPFFDINELKSGDAIVIETGTTWFTYRVENVPGTSARYQEIVSPTDLSVAYPVPDQPNPSAVPRLAVLTLTSCNPRYSAAQRIVIHAVLVARQPVSAGRPPALAGSAVT